ncbi:MAG: hypothetical protein ABIS03_08400 [Gemmatimonadaceae bacterium]
MILQSEVLPSHDDLLAQVEAAEHDCGWLARCDDEGQYVALNRQFVEALASVLLKINPRGRKVLEVCAGNGALAAGLRACGIDIVATDANPPFSARDVIPSSATTALREYCPSVVLGSFVPFDAQIDQAILRHEGVQAYVVLGARTGHECGSGGQPVYPGWQWHPLPLVTSYFVSRHDVWLGHNLPLLKKGEAWLLLRQGTVSTQPEELKEEHYAL